MSHQLRALKDATSYQGNQGEVKIVQGDGNAERLEGEVNFLSHYARQLGGFIREEEVVLIGLRSEDLSTLQVRRWFMVWEGPVLWPEEWS